MAREVVLVCGPPGAGKTTYARSLGLTVFDRDDPQWRNEAHFVAAVKRAALHPDARVVVIRAGASIATRKRTATIIKATRTVVLDVEADTCIRRVIARGRPTAQREIAGVRKWWAQHRKDQARAPIDRTKYRTPKYLAAQREVRRAQAAGEWLHCHEIKCVMPTRDIAPDQKAAVCHDTTGTVILGPGHARCNAHEAAVRGNRERYVGDFQKADWSL